MGKGKRRAQFDFFTAQGPDEFQGNSTPALT